jgi:hypothetical protein
MRSLSVHPDLDEQALRTYASERGVFLEIEHSAAALMRRCILQADRNTAEAASTFATQYACQRPTDE